MRQKAGWSGMKKSHHSQYGARWFRFSLFSLFFSSRMEFINLLEKMRLCEIHISTLRVICRSFSLHPLRRRAAVSARLPPRRSVLSFCFSRRRKGDANKRNDEPEDMNAAAAATDTETGERNIKRIMCASAKEKFSRLISVRERERENL